ncbi:MAG: hypothetical protein CME70_18890 [Halobacteriovorax sp.]|nr:hypothetical protein [Halobacteriovorax sp.]|tara:strand:+ start:7189 stop:7404 length:216 start_codon:yes stop_codon:yes gene_type:complete
MLETIQWGDLMAITAINMLIGGVVAFVYIAYDVRKRKREEARDLAAMRRVYGDARKKVQAENDKYYRRWGR